MAESLGVVTLLCLAAVVTVVFIHRLRVASRSSRPLRRLEVVYGGARLALILLATAAFIANIIRG